jgi:hypothetical protein
MREASLGMLAFVVLFAAVVAPLTMVGRMLLLGLAVLTFGGYLDRFWGFFLPRRRLIQGGALAALAACILVGLVSLFWMVQVLSPDPANTKAQAEASLMAIVFLGSGVWALFYMAIFRDCRKLVAKGGNHAH